MLINKSGDPFVGVINALIITFVMVLIVVGSLFAMWG